MEPRALFFVIDRIRMMFDLDSDWAVVAKTLRNDAALAQLVDAESGLRVPGCWSDFELTVRAILGQQNSFKEAATLAGRVVKACGQLVCRRKRPHAFIPNGGDPCGCQSCERRRATVYCGDAPRIRAGRLRWTDPV